MARKNRIAKELPADVRAELDAQIADGSLSIDELKEWLAERGHDDISRSGVARYVASQEDVISKIRESREMARAISAHLGDDDAGGARNAQLTEMLHSLMHAGMSRLLADKDAEVTTLDLGRLAKALQAATSSQKLDVDRRINAAKLAAAQAATKETEQKVVAALDAIGAGRPQETKEELLRRIREEVYGVFV